MLNSSLHSSVLARYSGCVNTIESVLGVTDGITEVHVDLDSQKATIRSSLSIKELVDALEELGTTNKVSRLPRSHFSPSIRLKPTSNTCSMHLLYILQLIFTINGTHFRHLYRERSISSFNTSGIRTFSQFSALYSHSRFDIQLKI